MRALLLVPALLLQAADPTPAFRPIGKPLADMPAAHDASSPENTYAALLRAYADGIADLRPLFASRLHGKLPKQGLKPRKEPARSEILASRIEDVLEIGDAAALIGTTGPLEKDGVDLWFLEREAGRWVLVGNDRFSSLDQARTKARKSLATLAKPAKEAPVANPEAHLAALVKHLETKGQEPKELLLEAMRTHRLTALGELHNRPWAWELYTRLVQDPRFAERVGTLYLELPRNGQALMDRFLASGTLDTTPVVDILRDFSASGWPSQVTVDFLAALWKVHRALPEGKRFRVRLVDQAWDWRAVQTKADLKTLTVERDALMAETILADLAGKSDPRNTFFLVGYLHLPSGLVMKGDSATRDLNAGERLRQKLGGGLFTLVTHGPVMSNGGVVEGRIRQGLFDEAFARRGDRAVAFPLKDSPFGREAFDCSVDHRAFAGTYGSAFDAYLFLGPLEQERFSPMVPGFYTEAFIQEADRRCRLMFGASFKDVEDLQDLRPASVTSAFARLWGAPMFWTTKLGPREAWRK